MRRTASTVALVVRLDQAPRRDVVAPPRHFPSCLPTWRLKRGLDFIEANLDRPIPLNALADTPAARGATAQAVAALKSILE